MYVCSNNLSIHFNFWLYMYVRTQCESSLNLLASSYNMGDTGAEVRSYFYIVCINFVLHQASYIWKCPRSIALDYSLILNTAHNRLLQRWMDKSHFIMDIKEKSIQSDAANAFILSNLLAYLLFNVGAFCHYEWIWPHHSREILLT